MEASASSPVNRSKTQPTSTAETSSIQKGRTSKPSAGAFARFFAIAKLFLLPYRFLSIIPASNRPVATWTYKTAFGVLLWRAAFKLLADLHLRGSRSLQPEKEKDVFTTLEPGPSTIYQGPLVSGYVKPVTIPAFWAPTAPPAGGIADNELIVIDFHGGAYVSFTSRMPALRLGPALLCKQLGSAFAMCVDYRKASDEGYSHFPAQLQDAPTAYSNALKLVRSSDQIIVSGDSAGGHIALSLVRYLEQFPVLPKPKAALLHSPWLDLTEGAVSLKNNPNANVDVISADWIAWGAESFTAPGFERDNEWISPGFHPFKTSVPIWVQAGSKEVFYDTIKKWVSSMESENEHVKLYTAIDAPHALYEMFQTFGLEKQEEEALADAAAFVHAI